MIPPADLVRCRAGHDPFYRG